MKKVNRDFPNYHKALIPVKVISHFPGQSRASRRQVAAQMRHAGETKKQFARQVEQENARRARAAKVARRVERATTRRMEREKAAQLAR